VGFSQNVALAAGSFLSLSGFSGPPSVLSPIPVASVLAVRSRKLLLSGSESYNDPALVLQEVWPAEGIDGSAQWEQASGILLLNLTRFISVKVFIDCCWLIEIYYTNALLKIRQGFSADPFYGEARCPPMVVSSKT